MTDVSRPPEYARTIFMTTSLIAEANLDVPRGLHHFTVRRNQSEAIDCFCERDMPHLVILIADHGSKMAFVRQLHRLDAKPGAKNPIQSCGGAASLQVTEHTGARFLARPRRDFTRQDVA